ncbi:MAG TPA: carboxymuconolactone decarboxylase family protein [Elusimicrobiota bacterium]|jgi:AhpD family alkylhydroperoxidase|nr:carboxymuconolactone decarboxylase family protein [Elusimicrobiota bacterium]
MRKHEKTEKPAAVPAKSWLAEAWPEGAQAMSGLRDAVYKNGTLDPKTRALIHLACVSLQRCRHCVDAVLGRLKNECGATDREIAEAMVIASMAAAGTNIAWAKETFHEHLG